MCFLIVLYEHVNIYKPPDQLLSHHNHIRRYTYTYTHKQTYINIYITIYHTYIYNTYHITLIACLYWTLYPLHIQYYYIALHVLIRLLCALYIHMNIYTYITMYNDIVYYISTLIYTMLYIVPTTYTLTPLYPDQLLSTLIISLTHNTHHDKKDRTQCVQPSLFITLFN